jgi:hypothetical protein
MLFTIRVFVLCFYICIKNTIPEFNIQHSTFHMIQRIQTIFLFLAAVAAIVLFFIPLAGVYSTMAAYKFYIYGIINMVPGEASVFSFMTTLPLLLLNLLVGGLAVVTIFLYKNRMTQLKLVRIAILLEIVSIFLVLFVYAKIIENNLQVIPEFLNEKGIYFPLISLVFLILAYRWIMKDEKLVRSVDRLR